MREASIGVTRKEFVEDVFNYAKHYGLNLDLGYKFKSNGGYTANNARKLHEEFVYNGTYFDGNSGTCEDYFVDVRTEENNDEIDDYSMKVYETSWGLYYIGSQAYATLSLSTTSLMNYLGVNEKWYANELLTKSKKEIREEFLKNLLSGLSMSDWTLTRDNRFRVVSNRKSWHKLLGSNLSKDYIYLGNEVIGCYE